MIQNVVEEHDTESVETSVSNIADQLVNGTKSKANNGWCGMRGNKWWGGFSLSECKWGWDAYSIISWGAIFLKAIFATGCAYAGGFACVAILGVLAAAVWVIKSYAGRGSDVANVCSSGRAKLTFQIWPLTNGTPTCD